MAKKNIGILASVSWNSNGWTGSSTDKDRSTSNFAHVKAANWTHEDLNFGHLKYPAEEDGYYIGYVPHFNRLPSKEESKNLEIVFLKSSDPVSLKTYVVGFYFLPVLGKFIRDAEHEDFDDYDWGNMKSLPENIIRLKEPLEISDTICALRGYLPKGKKLGKMGYNYLDYDSVMKLLDSATDLNSSTKIKSIKYHFLKEPSRYM